MKTWLIVEEEPLAGSSTSNLLRLLWQNKFRIHPKYLLRFWYATLVTVIFIPFRCIERILFNRKIRKTKITADPLYIIGNYRCGTTYLHTFLSLDKTKAYVSNVEAYAPHSFLTFPRLTKIMIGFSLPEKRPTDDVKMYPAAPQEEEYAVGAYDKYGFYNGFIFPRNFDQYLKYNSFEECSPKDLKRWKKRYYFFMQKMTLKAKGKMLICKNPSNSFRIKYLLKMFPNVKFIHLYRNPYTLFASIERWFKKVFELYALQTWDDDKILKDWINHYKDLNRKLNEDRPMIPEGNIIDIKYEDFIKDPIVTLERIYRELQLDGFEESKEAFQRHIDEQVDFKVNIHEVTDRVIQIVNNNWGFTFEQFNYERLEPKG